MITADFLDKPCSEGGVTRTNLSNYVVYGRGFVLSLNLLSEGNMKEVYIVTSGSYSDYAIDAVFTSRKTAEIFADKIDGEVEIWEISPSDLIDKITHDKIFCVRMNKEGNTDLVIEATFDSGEIKNAIEKKTIIFNAVDGLSMVTYMFAKDKKHAVKIANERRIQLIANNKWNKQKEKS